MDPATIRSQRLAAAVFLAVCVPAVVAIAASGGLVALAPLLLLVVPILATGRAPGVDALERLRASFDARPRRAPRSIAPKPGVLRTTFNLNSRLLAAAIARRGPPLLG